MPLMGLLLHQHHLQNIFLEDCPQENSVTSDFLMGREKKQISSMDLVFMSLTRRPSLVRGVHSVALALPLRAPWPLLTVVSPSALKATASPEATGLSLRRPPPPNTTWCFPREEILVNIFHNFDKHMLS
uniref:Uncharacterized protein n=1 Tax=Molossus molossus TaxID=27622 RepID=A0A7J8FSR8_MOLMO|nr:hypothetical protein HJG59_008353 [Molossus molossus]